MTTLTIDGTTYTADTEGKNLLEVCLGLGLNVPYFCWHPAFRSIGACRQCAVKVFKNETDTRGRIEMSCMIPVTEGMRVSIDDPDAVAFRAKVIEWLMVNHPHDCPVCDEGGECHLQDMTVMTGHVYRRYRFTKRTHHDQDLGPFVNMEMNRCIQCYRCVRFYRGYAGGRDFDVMGWHDHVYFGRHEEGTLDNEFSGNLVEVCPTGVFTDKPLKKRYARKWDLQTAPSVCVHCGLGCNTIPGERYGMLRRVSPRYNGEVNGYFLCDRGRYGFEFVNGDRRLRQPLIREDGSLNPVTREQALARSADILRAGRVIGIGSPRASLESNFALRALVGPDRYHHGITDTDLRLAASMIRILSAGPVPAPSLHEVETCDAVLVLGEDVTHAAPMLDLALRQAVLQKPKAEAMKLGIYEWLDECLRETIQDDRGPLFIATPGETKLDPLAAGTCRAAPDDIARLGFAVAHELDPAAPAVPDLAPKPAALAVVIAAGLKSGKRPLIVSGPGCRNQAVIEAAASVAWALRRAGLDARLCFTVPECNSMGAALIPGAALDSAVAQVRSGAADTVVLLENDIFRRLDRASAETILGVKHLIVLDHLASATVARAEVALPSAAFPEAAGTLINNEGRAQRFFQVFAPTRPIDAAWRWLGELAAACGKTLSTPWPDLDAVIAAIAEELPTLSGIRKVAPSAAFRQMGRRVPRQASRFSGRTAITANVDVHEPQPPPDPDSPLSFTMEGSPLQPPSSLIPRFWAPRWNSAQAVNKFQMEIGGPLRGGDPGVRLIAPDLAASPPYFAGIPRRFTRRADEWLFLPACHIFGSEECSALANAVAVRIPAAYIGINRGDAEQHGIAEGQIVAVTLGTEVCHWPARLKAEIPEGTAILPSGLRTMPTWSLPAWGRLTVSPEGPRP